MKKIIIAINNKKILEQIKKINNSEILSKKIEYREAILEMLKKQKNINYILINEKLPGEISIENLINKIKIINKKINIIFFLEKEDVKKENKLKKLGIKNIYIINKIKKHEILNLLGEKNLEKEEKTKIKFKDKINKILKIKISKKNKYNNNINKKNNKIITIYGEKKSGKSTIINLIIIYLIEKNKKILLINLNKKMENNYLILLGKKCLKENNKKNNDKFKNNLKNSEIKINENLTVVYDFQKNFKNEKIKTSINKEKVLEIFLQQHIENFDYILVDINSVKNKMLIKEIIKKSDKKIIVWDRNFLGIKEIRKLIKKSKNSNNKFDNSLHIIQNKYYFNSISYLITKNIFEKLSNVHRILYSKKYNYLSQKISKNQKVKLNKFIKNKIEKILK